LQNQSLNTKYFSDKQLAARYGTTRTTVWRWVQKYGFPAPVKLSPGCARWPIDRIEAYEKEVAAKETE